MFVVFILMRDGASLISEMPLEQAQELVQRWKSGAEYLDSPHPNEIWSVASKHIQAVRTATKEQFLAMTGQAAAQQPQQPQGRQPAVPSYGPSRYVSGN